MQPPGHGVGSGVSVGRNGVWANIELVAWSATFVLKHGVKDS